MGLLSEATSTVPAAGTVIAEALLPTDHSGVLEGVIEPSHRLGTDLPHGIEPAPRIEVHSGLVKLLPSGGVIVPVKVEARSYEV